MLSGKQDSGAHRIHHPINFFFFFFQVTTAPPLSPLRWAPEVPWPSACSGITPGTPPSPTCEEPRSFSAQLRGPRQGQRPPALLPGPAPAPLQPRAALRGRGVRSSRGPHRHSPSTFTQHPVAGQGVGMDSALALAHPPKTTPFRGITFSPWTLQMLPLRAFKDLGMRKVS